MKVLRNISAFSFPFIILTITPQKPYVYKEKITAKASLGLGDEATAHFLLCGLPASPAPQYHTDLSNPGTDLSLLLQLCIVLIPPTLRPLIIH